MVGRVLALMLAVGLVAAGCSSGDNGSSGGTSQPALGDAAADGEVTDAEPVVSGENTEPTFPNAPGEPIKIGEVSSYSGLNIFPEAVTIARVVLREYNENGGVDGRPIQLISVDDQDTLQGAASGARRLLDEEEVIGFGIGGSISDCQANAEFYAERGIEVLGVTAACVVAPTVHAVNAGPFFPTLHTLDYFKHDLGRENICFVGYQVPLTEAFEGIFLPLWEEVQQQELTAVLSPEPSEDLTPSVVQLKNEGCDAVLAAFTELNYQGFFQIAEEQGLLEEMDVGMLTSGYSLSLLDASGEIMDGVYTNSEYEPFTGSQEKSPEVEGYLDLTTSLGLLPTSFGEGGYIAAHILIDVLESIEGEINFESFQEAVRNVEYPSEAMGDTFTATGMAVDPPAQPNVNSQILQLDENLVFQPVSDWRTFPYIPEP